MRTYDAVIFGASGFTGQHIAVEWAKTATPGLRWAIAGRSRSKLQAVNEHVKAAAGLTEDIPMVIADVFDEPAMQAMAAATRLVINCTGPFRLFGEPVVRACVGAGTHYVDITGEPQFIETMALRYHGDAVAKDALIVHSCGFDSIPSDMGVAFTAAQFPAAGCCAAVEAFITLHGKRAHATTYECIVLGLSAADTLKGLRQALPKVPYFGPKLPVRTWGYDARIPSYFVKFMGADASVVRATQRHLAAAGVPPVQFSVYVTFARLATAVPLFIGGFFLWALSRFAWGRHLLISYPEWFTFGFFSHAGPTPAEMAQSGFHHRFFAHGYSDKAATAGKPNWRVEAAVQGPEPGYVATSSMVVAAARVILNGETAARGVLTPGAAFRGTSLIDRLQQRGIEFSVTKSEPISQ